MGSYSKRAPKFAHKISIHAQLPKSAPDDHFSTPSTHTILSLFLDKNGGGFSLPTLLISHAFLPLLSNELILSGTARSEPPPANAVRNDQRRSHHAPQMGLNGAPRSPNQCGQLYEYPARDLKSTRSLGQVLIG